MTAGLRCGVNTDIVPRVPSGDMISELMEMFPGATFHSPDCTLDGYIQFHTEEPCLEKLLKMRNRQLRKRLGGNTHDNLKHREEWRKRGGASWRSTTLTKKFHLLNVS